MPRCVVHLASACKTALSMFVIHGSALSGMFGFVRLVCSLVCVIWFARSVLSVLLALASIRFRAFARFVCLPVANVARRGLCEDIAATSARVCRSASRTAARRHAARGETRAFQDAGVARVCRASVIRRSYCVAAHCHQVFGASARRVCACKRAAAAHLGVLM